MAEGNSVLYLRRMPTNLKAQFKAHCAARNISMTEKIIEFMRSCIRETQSNDVRRSAP